MTAITSHRADQPFGQSPPWYAVARLEWPGGVAVVTQSLYQAAVALAPGTVHATADNALGAELAAVNMARELAGRLSRRAEHLKRGT